MTESSPYQVPRQPGRWRAIALAVVVHLALLAFLWIGIRWQNETPMTVEAEIWDAKIREAAPLPQEPEPPQPTSAPQPMPAPEPEPVKPPPTIEEPPVAKPDIVLKMEKKRQEEEKKREKEERAKREREKEERLKKQKEEADKKLAKQKQDAEARKKAEADKLAAEKKQKQAAETKAAEQRRQDDLKRMMSQASSSGGAGDATQSQGPRGNADYTSKLSAKIRSNTIFDVPGDLNGNPAVEYTVELLPDGSVRSIRKGKPSGLTGFDDAVERAIKKSQPFPPDKNGKVPSRFTFTHKPKDS